MKRPRLVHYPMTIPALFGVEGVSYPDRAACSVKTKTTELSADADRVTCRRCIRSLCGPRPDEAWEERERQSERAARKAKDRREAEQAVLARHPDELEAELALRALARVGS